MAVASMHLGVWSWSRQSPEQSQNGKERGFKQFWAWHGTCSVFLLLQLSNQPISVWFLIIL